jgi:predicted site-specific integrase-resolvase
MFIQHLTQTELAKRWHMSHRTLERWRVQGGGPMYLKINGRVRYRQNDIEAYEHQHTHVTTDTKFH